MIQTTMTIKGQVTIPKEVRDGLGLHQGDKVAFLVDGRRALLYPMKGGQLNLRGIVKRMTGMGPISKKRMRKASREYVVSRYLAHRHDK